MTIVCILDYGSGNVKSVCNLFSAIADEVVVSNHVSDISKASHLVLPGVGAFGAAMRKIRENLPILAIEKEVLIKKKPFLGICVGMQVLAEQGAEFGVHHGLGWIKGRVKKLDLNNLPLPHIGWNDISIKQPSPLLTGLGNEPDFYFVHSYVFEVENELNVVATTEYGKEFCCVIQKENLFGVQFHPEKSQRAGLKLAANFLSLR
jgi:glutamine amidotransferase